MNFLVLVAGYPGTGKSYLCNMIIKRYGNMILLSPDIIKEMFWDKYGFRDINEKNRLIDLSWRYYYQKMIGIMEENKNIISDYPFSNKQKHTLMKLTERYSYNVITVKLTADLEILFLRQKQRDLDPKRHPGHILKAYTPTQPISSRKNADGLLSYEEFLYRCRTRGYDNFSLGKVFEIDVSVLSSEIYDDLFKNLDVIIKK